MATELAKKRVEIKVVEEIHGIIGGAVVDIAKMDLTALTKETNRQIELGADNERDAERIRQGGFDALKAAKAIRLQFTEPVVQYQKMMIAKVDTLMSPLLAANTKLKGILNAKEQARRDAERKAQEEHDRKVREAEEAAAKQTANNKAISIGMVGGDASHIKVVEPEKVPAHITYPTTKVTSARSLPDNEKIQTAIDSGIHSIPGVEIEQVWTFKVIESKEVPEKYRSLK